MGLLLSVFAGTHICPDGEVKVWQGSVERSLLDVITRQQRLDFMQVQQMVRDQFYRLWKTEKELFQKGS